MTYSIIRFYAPHVDKPNETISEGLSLEEAQEQEHCADPGTACNDFFDGFQAEE